MVEQEKQEGISFKVRRSLAQLALAFAQFTI